MVAGEMKPMLVGGFDWMHGVGYGPLDTCPPHRWRIAENSHGVASEGVCVQCGATRAFSNVEPEYAAKRHTLTVNPRRVVRGNPAARESA